MSERWQMHKTENLFSEDQMGEQTISLKEKINQMFTDLYLGRDKDNLSITTRLTLLEKNTERILSNSSKVTWLLLAAVVGMFGELLRDIILHVK